MYGFFPSLILVISLSLGLLQLSHREGLAECATQEMGTSSLHVSPDLCADKLPSLGLLLLLEATLGSLKPLSELLAAELSSLCQEGLVGMGWEVCPVGGWLSPRFTQPDSPRHCYQHVNSAGIWFPYLGTKDQQGTWNPYRLLFPRAICPLMRRPEGCQGGPSVLHLAGGLVRRGAHLGHSSQKPPTPLCFRIGVSPADGK